MHSYIKYWIAGIGALLIIMIAGMTVHQKNHFNKNVTINNIAVGGLTAKQAFDKVKGTSGATKVYVDNKLVYQTKSMKAISLLLKIYNSLSDFVSSKSLELASKPFNT